MLLTSEGNPCFKIPINHKRSLKLVSAAPIEMPYTVAPAPGTSDKALVCPYAAHYSAYRCNRYRIR